MSSSRLVWSACVFAYLVFSSIGRAAPRLRVQDGANDPTFNVIDDAVYGDGVGSPVYATALQPDGKVIIGGEFNSYNDEPCIRIVRLNVDGSFDPSFDVGAGPASSGGTLKFALQPDGKLIAVGSFSSFGGQSRPRIARTNSDGSLDTTFQPGGGANGQITAIALQPDGRIVIGGMFTAYDLVPRNFVARVESDGSLDTSFPPGLGPNATVFAVAVQPDGRVLIGGHFTSVDGQPRQRIARLLPTGDLDPSFGNSPGADGQVQALALQSDGKIVITGAFVSFDGVARPGLARLLADGSLDTSFNPGSPSNGTLPAVGVLPNGQVLVGGQFSSFAGFTRHGFARLNADGSVDPTFVRASDGRIVYSFVVHANGSATLGGGVTFLADDSTIKSCVARTLPDGALDPSFNPVKGTNGRVTDIAVQSDGKAVVGGWFSTFNAIPRGRVARLNLDGSLDVGYANDGVDSGRVEAITLQPDGKAVIAGEFWSVAGVPRVSIARLDVDGTLDMSFDPGAGIGSGNVNTLALQPDGRVLVAGDFATYDGVQRWRIARVHANGTLDTSFDAGDGPNGRVLDLALQPDGRVLLAGEFSGVSGVIRKHIARLNADGSHDTSLDPGPATNGFINAIALQNDGRIVIGSSIGTYGGIARLFSNGNLDPSFATLTLSPPNVRRVLTQPDGKHIVLGNFTQAGGVPRGKIARLTQNGSLDPSFTPGTGANAVLAAAALLPDGDLIVGGMLTSYAGAARHRIARVHASWEPGLTYCAAGTSTNGCTPSIGFSGSPHVSASSGFTIDVSNLEGQRQGLIFYGLSGRRADPWAVGSSSFICVKSPKQRMTFANSGGSSGLCNGVLSSDWLAFLAAHPSALGTPFSAGTTVNAQAWYRDPPAPKATNLSNALEFVTTP